MSEVLLHKVYLNKAVLESVNREELRWGTLGFPCSPNTAARSMEHLEIDLPTGRKISAVGGRQCGRCEVHGSELAERKTGAPQRGGNPFPPLVLFLLSLSMERQKGKKQRLRKCGINFSQKENLSEPWTEEQDVLSSAGLFF